MHPSLYVFTTLRVPIKTVEQNMLHDQNVLISSRFRFYTPKMHNLLYRYCMDQAPTTKLKGTVGRSGSSLIPINSEDSNLVHVWEFSNNQYKHCNCVEEKHWVLVISCV